MSESGILREYVTAEIGGELIGLPILRVQDVFIPEAATNCAANPTAC
jgi:hypothetical protein